MILNIPIHRNPKITYTAVPRFLTAFVAEELLIYDPKLEVLPGDPRQFPDCVEFCAVVCGVTYNADLDIIEGHFYISEVRELMNEIASSNHALYTEKNNLSAGIATKYKTIIHRNENYTYTVVPRFLTPLLKEALLPIDPALEIVPANPFCLPLDTDFRAVIGGVPYYSEQDAIGGHFYVSEVRDLMSEMPFRDDFYVIDDENDNLSW